MDDLDRAGAPSPGLRSFLFALAVAVLGSLMPAPAIAQDCGSWNRPVLCRADLVATDSSGRSVRLGDRSRIEMAPREEITLELDGRDQGGRRFPAERLALGFVGGGNCSGMLGVENRGEGELRVAARVADGRCTLAVWVPNNLNFYWEIDFEISAGARRGYSRSEAEFVVKALYQAILGRDPDPPGFSSGVGEAQAGNLEPLVSAMFRSPEFRQKSGGMSASDLLEQFYHGILGRESDSAGARLYLGDMRRAQYTSVLLKLIRSPEFERRLEGR